MGEINVQSCKMNVTMFLNITLQLCYGFSTALQICICTFTAAWEGRFCESDVDGCDEISCYEGVDCFDVPAPGEGAMCGPCPMGFSGDGQKCLGTFNINIAI